MGGGADDERMVDLLGRKQGWEIGRRRQPELRYGTLCLRYVLNVTKGCCELG